MARICLQFASKWKDDVNNEDAIKGLVFAKQMALKLEVENILHKNSLNRTSSYLELVQQNKFSELIMALYEDESIILSCTSNEDKQWPNINKACSEIGMFSNTGWLEKIYIFTIATILSVSTLQRRVIRGWNGNFVGFSGIFSKIVKNLSMKRYLHFSGKRQLRPTRI